jgi:hypothetical protein
MYSTVFYTGNVRRTSLYVTVFQCGGVHKVYKTKAHLLLSMVNFIKTLWIKSCSVNLLSKSAKSGNCLIHAYNWVSRFFLYFHKECSKVGAKPSKSVGKEKKIILSADDMMWPNNMVSSDNLMLSADKIMLSDNILYENTFSDNKL